MLLRRWNGVGFDFHWIGVLCRVVEMRTTVFSPYRTPLVSVPFRDNAKKLKKD